MSPVRATLLHSPGWNEGKARYKTLGTYKTKNYMSSFRSGTFSAHVWFVLRSGEYRSYGAQRMLETINPGLAPWAMKKYRPVGALRRHHHDNEYDVLTSVSTRKHFGKYAHSLKWVRRTFFSTWTDVNCTLQDTSTNNRKYISNN